MPSINCVRKVQFVSTGPQRLPDWNIGAAGIKAFYFQDPDRHNLEVISFPPGKGDPRWQEKTNKLFLGIDHTAITVAQTDASLRFYSDLLGFRKAGESENYGTEQEHLNQIFGAHLRITAMRAMSGPGIEFLEYLSATVARASTMRKRTILSTGRPRWSRPTLKHLPVSCVASMSILCPPM